MTLFDISHIMFLAGKKGIVGRLSSPYAVTYSRKEVSLMWKYLIKVFVSIIIFFIIVTTKAI